MNTTLYVYLIYVYYSQMSDLPDKSIKLMEKLCTYEPLAEQYYQWLR